jgi:uncharacterized protein YlxW (UPF0749 family)
MNIKEKIISILKAAGIAILGFIAAFIYGKLFISAEDKDKKQREDIKDTINDVKQKINTVKDSINEQNTIISDIKNTIEQHESTKDDILNTSIKDRIEYAEQAGFKKK